LRSGMIVTTKRFLGRAAITAVVIVTLATAWYVSPLYQTTKVWAASRGIERLVVDGRPQSPEHGGIVRCENGEWIIVSLHHGSRGFTLLLTSDGSKYIERDYRPHPVIECWGGIIRGGYDSIADFFAKQRDISFIHIK